MLKKILMASLAVGALAFNAPAAMAATQGGCGFDSVQNETATGQNYEGVAYGYAVDDTGASVTIKCYITVDGTTAPGAIVTGTGTGVAVAGGPISFEAADGADVELCTQINNGTPDCGDSTNTQIPPQEVIDAIDSVFQLIADATAGLDPIICGALQTAGAPALINGTTSVTTISMDADDCDLYLGGEQLIDFVPYGA